MFLDGMLFVGLRQWRWSGVTVTLLATLLGKAFHGEWYIQQLKFLESSQFEILAVCMVCSSIPTLMNMLQDTPK